MSYEFIKLSEVEKVDTSYNANLLIEEDGEIKRLSTENINFGGSGEQVQADWNETDDTSPAFIANKPAVGEAITFYMASSGILGLNGQNQTLQYVKDVWDSGVNVKLKPYSTSPHEGVVLAMCFTESSGTAYGSLWYLNESGIIKQENFY